MSLRLPTALALGALAGCAPPPEGPPVVRLVDLFPQATIEGAAETATASDDGGWRFDAEPEPGGDATRGWRAGSGVEALGVRDGRLAGRSTGDFPVIHAERAGGEDDEDLLHAVELRLRVSAGGEVSLAFSDDEELNLEEVLGRARIFPWSTTAELEPGDAVKTYTVRPGFDVASSEIRHVLLRPTDAEGAEFELESLRLVFRREHLAEAGAGIGWHGMSDVYREAIATRAGETARWRLALPARPRLDLALATVEAGPVTFRVAIEADGAEHVVLERTLTTPHRWEPVTVDLAAFAGREARLALSSSAERPGAAAFWGTPVVRDRRAGDGGAGGAGAGRPRGVIVIVGDTLRSDHLDAWGYGRDTAPVLAGLAERGMRAEDCIAQATWTKVSVPSIFTSLYPLTHGVRQFTDRLPASATTLAEVFRDAGYATVGYSSIPFTGKITNLHQGYEEFHEAASLPPDRNAKTARLYVDRLLPWLERHRDVPFYVFLHVADPHSPYLPYPPYDTVWGEPGDQAEYRRQQEQVRPLIENPLMRRFGMPERSELIEAGLDPERYVALELDAYDGSIRAMDVEIGRLLERLRELGLDERTLIAFVSDHGTEFLDHDEHFHGHSVYGELARVPMLLHGPGVSAGVVISETVQTLDLMPTILELADLEPPAGMQGQSLVPLFGAGERSDENRRFRARPAFTEKAYDGADDSSPRDDGLESYAIVLDGWKLVHNPRRPEGRPEIELYNHREDPLNHHDLAAELPQLVEQLAPRLAAWRESAEAQRLVSDAELTEGMSAEDLERLRSLGYVQ